MAAIQGRRSQGWHLGHDCGARESQDLYEAVLMAKRLTKIEREMRDHPEKFDFGDIPPDRKIYPDQEKRLDDLRPQWAKDLAGN